MTILSEHRPAPGRHRPVTRAQLALRFDYVQAICTLFVAALGVLMVYSATRDNFALVGNDTTFYLKRQAGYVIVGAVVMGVLAVLDYHWLEHASAVIYIVVILGLLSMFVIGSSALGATRWLQLGPVQIQPSAFATLGLIVIIATYCSRRPKGIDFTDLVKILALSVLPIILVAKQPDLGSAIVMSVVLLVMLVVAGIPGRYLLLLLAICAVGVVGIVHLHLLQPYEIQRITGFIHSKGGKVTAGHLHPGPIGVGDREWRVLGSRTVPRRPDESRVRPRAEDRLHILGGGRAARIRGVGNGPGVARPAVLASAQVSSDGP